MAMSDKERLHLLEWLWINVFDTKFGWNLYKNQASADARNDWLQGKISNFRSKCGYDAAPVDAADLKKLGADIGLYHSLSSGTQNVPLKDAVRRWGKISVDRFYLRVGVRPLPKEPKVYLGPSRSDGHYDPKRHRIFVDPRKNKTPDKRMEVLEFEILNAANKSALKNLASSTGSATDKAWKSIGLEYKNSKRELEKLIRKYKARNIEDLVENKIGIDKKILGKYKKAMFNENTIRTRRVPMPPTTQLKDQDKRNALFFYQVRHWKDDQIIKEYAYRPHTPTGRESTLEQEIRKYTKR